MKKIFLPVLLSWLSFLVKAQPSDSLFQGKKLSKTDIRLTLSYYNQDGNNSAVTGGIGTEKLKVFVFNLDLDHTFNNRHSLDFQAGFDIISSASTDKIDFVVSSASKVDIRYYANANYSRKLKNENLTIRSGTGFSLESDYFSFPVNLGISYAEPSKMRTLDIDFQAYFDDLRWGRLHPDYYRPAKLIYPFELRNQEWYDQYRRNSYNLKLALTQVLNKRTVLGIMPEVSYQQGLLATPFHRVFFDDGSHKVENFPEHRLKFPIAVQLNYFAGSRLIIKSNYQFYTDSFGILGNAFKLELPIKIRPDFSVAPLVRIYSQSASRYFKPYMEHAVSEVYYTSDYDFSRLRSTNAGITLRYAPYKYIRKKLLFNEINLMYSFYHRSNGLNAHMFSLWIDWTHKKSVPNSR